MTTFTEVRELVERYYCARLAAGISRLGEHLLQEVRARLRQLQWAHQRMLEIEGTFESQRLALVPPGDTPPEIYLWIFTEVIRPNCATLMHAHGVEQPQDELRFLLEGYYYSAHRVRDILRDNREDLPGLSGFEAAGVRNVRNHLVEHPTRKSGVVLSSFKCGGPTGPQLKPMRWSLDAPGTEDAGLHENTREFLGNLDRTLRTGLVASPVT